MQYESRKVKSIETVYKLAITRAWEEFRVFITEMIKIL